MYGSVLGQRGIGPGGGGGGGEGGGGSSYVLFFSLADEELTPAVGHDEADAEEVIGGLEASGWNVALRTKKMVSFCGWVGGIGMRMRTLYWIAS